MTRIFNARCKLNLAEITAARKLAARETVTISEMLRGLIRSASKAVGENCKGTSAGAYEVSAPPFRRSDR